MSRYIDNWIPYWEYVHSSSCAQSRCSSQLTQRQHWQEGHSTDSRLPLTGHVLGPRPRRERPCHHHQEIWPCRFCHKSFPQKGHSSSCRHVQSLYRQSFRWAWSGNGQMLTSSWPRHKPSGYRYYSYRWKWRKNFNKSITYGCFFWRRKN